MSLRPLLIYRALGGPRPDERLRVEIVSSRARSQLTTAVAAADIAAGLRTLELVVGDERVAQLIKRHGIVREYVEDYETGRVRMATLAPDAAAIWDGAPPSA